MRTTLVELARGAALALAVLLVAGILARQFSLLDRHFIFFPDRELALTPSDAGLEYEDARFSASDGVKLHGWFVPGKGDTTLVWFHGNAGNIGGRVDNILLLNQRLGVNVFIFDYRGYGQSEGKPSEKGTYLDAEAALAYLRSRQGSAPDEKLVLIGRSLGCAVAAEMATRHRVHGVILESPFTSIRAMARRTYPYLPTGILVQFIQTRYDTLSKIKDVHSPLMVLHGDQDEMIPFEQGRELFDAANEPKRFYSIEGASHNDTYVVGGDAYFEALKRFVEDPAGGGG